MKPALLADQLIRSLLVNPRRFEESGRAYQLLQAYLNGAPVDTLRDLFRHDDIFVKRAAVFVLSELGRMACPLLDDVIPLLGLGDRYLTFNAMESVGICSIGPRAAEFSHILLKLDDSDEVVRSLAMFLMANAEMAQLTAAWTRISQSPSSEHQRGLRVLIDASPLQEAVRALIRSDAPLSRRYGAVAAARLYVRQPELINEAKATGERDVVSFIRSFLRSRGVA